MTPSITTSMSGRAWIMLILLSILWGGSFFFVGSVVNALAPFTIVTLRVGIAALTLWIVVFLLGLRPPTSVKIWGAFIVMGLLNNVIPFVMIVWGQTQVASGLASILNAATPIFAVIVAGLLLPDEKPTALKLIGVIIGFFGVVLMIGLPTIGNALDSTASLIAQLAIIAATLSYAFAGVYGRRFKPMQLNPIVIAAGQVTCSTLVLIPITLTLEGPLNVAETSLYTWIAITGLAVFSTAFAYILYFKILEVAGATNVLLVTLLVPISAILLGWLFLNESLQAIHFLGMGLIALGLSAIDGRLWRRHNLKAD